MTGDLLDAVVPAGGVAAFSVRDFGAAGPLLPDELAALGPAGPGRTGEFAAGRHCARAAMATLGRPGVAVLRTGRAPRWPAGLVGSITHCTGYAAAVVGHASTVDSIGIDVEPNLALPGIVAPRITVPAERAWLETAPRCGVHWDRLLFAIKESVYKAWAPLTGTWLDFTDATVTIDVAGQRFQATIADTARPGPAAPTGFAGRFRATPDLVLAAIVVPVVSIMEGPA